MKRPITTAAATGKPNFTKISKNNSMRLFIIEGGA